MKKKCVVTTKSSYIGYAINCNVGIRKSSIWLKGKKNGDVDGNVEILRFLHTDHSLLSSGIGKLYLIFVSPLRVR